MRFSQTREYVPFVGLSDVFRIDGREVTKAEYEAALPKKLGNPQLAGLVGDLRQSGQLTAGWPIHSDAMGVHPKDVAAEAAFVRKAGVPTQFDGKGRPILESRAHRRKYMKALGVSDKHSFTGY